jgi:hypothetical protein
MPRSSRKPRSKAEFQFNLPVKVSRARFRLHSAFRHIDPRRLANKAQVEIEVGTFEGDGGCGRTVAAIVRNGTVIRLKVTPCAETRAVKTDSSLRSLMAAARRQLGGTTRPPKFKPMSFARFQDTGGDITIKTITCIQICIFGHCIVCCTTPDGSQIFCGSRVIIHTP